MGGPGVRDIRTEARGAGRIVTTGRVVLRAVGGSTARLQNRHSAGPPAWLSCHVA